MMSRPAQGSGTGRDSNRPKPRPGDGFRMGGRRRWMGIALAALASGCSVAPRGFRDLKDPAPIVRARAVGYEDRVAYEVAVPALIARLDDPDPVVRLSAHEALRKRTGQDFGFLPWAEPAERGKAIARWRS